jgi:cell division protein FtsA
MPKSDNIIVGIDIGTHKVCTIVAEADAGTGSRINVLGVGAVASEGMFKGMVTDIVKASSSVAHSLEAAERQSGCRILSAYVSISGNHISSINNRGLVAVSNPDRIVGQDDVTRAIEAARAIAIPAGRDVLHVIPRTYTVDGQEGIRNPIGLSGFRLDVEAHIVTCANNVRENLIRCVQQADVEVDDLVLSPLASAEAVLTEQEKNLGVVLVDIGHGTTDIAVYADGSVWHSKVIPVGGWQLTNDLAVVFNIPYEAAEALKLQYGHAVVPGTAIHTGPRIGAHPWPTAHSSNGKSHPYTPYPHSHAYPHAYPDPQPPHSYAYNDGLAHGLARTLGQENSAVGLSTPEDYHTTDGSGDRNAGASRSRYQRPEHPEDEVLEAQGFSGETVRIRRSQLNEVIAARLDQMFALIGDEIRRSGYESLLPAGVVLTGGVASMPGIEPHAAHKLKMPVRTGRPQRIGGLSDAFDSPAYATSVGLILWGMRQSGQGTSPRIGPYMPASARRGTGEDRANSLLNWLKSFLPRD